MTLAMIRRSMLAAALLMSAPAALAQGPGPAMPPMGGSPAQMQAQQLQMELAQIDQQLQVTQKKVLDADPSLVQKQSAIGDKIQSAMESKPETKQKLERLDEIRAKLDASGAAPGSPPSPEMQQLIMEGQQVSMSLQQAQEEVMTSEPLKSEIAAFEKTMTDKMKAADPNAEGLFERREEVIEKLMALAGPPAMGPVAQ